MELTQIVGVVGAVTYLVSYLLLQANVVKGEGVIYAALNMAAAIMVLISLMSAFNIGSLIIQVSFIVLSLLAIARIVLMRRPVRASAQDRALAAVLLPGIPMRRAQHLIARGVWIQDSDLKLTREGRRAEALYFIYKGRALVTSRGKRLAELGDGVLVGDMSCLTGEPASADVVLNGPSYVWKISVLVLERELTKMDDLRTALELGMSRQMREKLKARNKEVALAGSHASGSAV